MNNPLWLALSIMTKEQREEFFDRLRVQGTASSTEIAWRQSNGK